MGCVGVIVSMVGFELWRGDDGGELSVVIVGGSLRKDNSIDRYSRSR
jgi:hypothetical protein